MPGLDRFIDFLVRHHADNDNVSFPETLSRLAHSVLDYHDGVLDDDATVLCREWQGPGDEAAV